MTKLSRNRVLAALVCALGVVGTIFAQTEIPTGTHIIRTTPRQSVATTGARSPGTMVNAGVARTLVNTRQAQSPIEITEQGPAEVDALDLFIPEAVDILLDEVNALLFYFGNLLLERAGLPAIPLPNDNSNNNDNDNDNDNGGRPDKPVPR